MFKKILIPAIFMVFILATVASAVDSEYLVIDTLRAEVDGDREDVVNGETIDVKPGESIELIIKLKNLYDDVTDNDLEDILVEAFLEGIDDGDDLEMELDEFDLNTERSKTIRVEFEIPLRVDETDTYDLNINIKGEDQNNTDHTIDLTFVVNVEKNNHDVRFDALKVSPDTIACGGTARVTAHLVNVGEDEEEDVKFRVDIESLGRVFSDTFTLSENYDDDESEYAFDRLIDFDGLDEGIYSIILEADYASDRKTIVESIPLNIGLCEEEEPAPEPTPAAPEPAPEAPKEEVVDVVVQQTQAPPASAPTQQAQTSFRPSSTLRDSGSDDTKWIVAIVATDIALVVLGVLIYAGLKKKGGRSY